MFDKPTAKEAVPDAILSFPTLNDPLLLVLVSVKICPLNPPDTPFSPYALIEAIITLPVLEPETKFTDSSPTYILSQYDVSVPNVLPLPEGIALPPRVIFAPEKGSILFTLTLLIVFLLFSYKYIFYFNY